MSTSSKVRVIVFTASRTTKSVVLAVQAGASGFLHKNVTPAKLVSAVRVVAAREARFSPRHLRRLVDRLVDQPRDGTAP